MAEQRIEITIDQDGKIEASSEGFKGETCLAELEKLLGEFGHAASVSKKDAFYQRTQASVANRITMSGGNS
ncbi:MAG: DUF2997 domain-containing protein [Treponema sp.]|jgi:hypothetical protein|nr:DUF2997 domain-containing protein [Treponema sp.]